MHYAEESFGRVNSTTHAYYETMIAPVVTLLKIEANIKFTNGTLKNDAWELPANLRPAGLANLGTPNANLLGWRRAERLTDNQRQMFRSADILAENFSVVNIII